MVEGGVFFADVTSSYFCCPRAGFSVSARCLLLFLFPFTLHLQRISPSELSKMRRSSLVNIALDINRVSWRSGPFLTSVSGYHRRFSTGIGLSYLATGRP